MPKPSETARKIEQLTAIAIAEYKIDANIMRLASERVKKINDWASTVGFPDTDVFMSSGGIFVLSTYWYDGSLEITVLADDYDVFIEKDGTRIDYKQHQTKPQVMLALRIFQLTLVPLFAVILFITYEVWEYYRYHKPLDMRRP